MELSPFFYLLTFGDFPALWRKLSPFVARCQSPRDSPFTQSWLVAVVSKVYQYLSRVHNPLIRYLGGLIYFHNAQKQTIEYDVGQHEHSVQLLGSNPLLLDWLSFRSCLRLFCFVLHLYLPYSLLRVEL